uniref:Lipase_3 domain-containing protein n=1 Tax=Strongyloides venezuelensis TaxID=75913 RepID=A0A0K0F3P7_STRVS
MVLVKVVFIFLLKINFLTHTKSLFTHKSYYDEELARKLYLLCYESNLQDAGRCIPKYVGGFETFYLYSSKLIRCDHFRNKCAFFIMVSKVKSVIIVVFSGSLNTNQLLRQGLSLFQKRILFHQIGWINRYYASSFEKLWLYVKRVFLDYKYRNFKTYITGHSLGGVFASLTAIKVQVLGLKKSQDIYLYTFGAPRFGSYIFSANFNFRIPNSYRVVLGSDIVPHFPPCKKVKDRYLKFYTKLIRNFRKKTNSRPCDPRDLHGYYHHGHEIWYPTGTEFSFVECTGFPKNEDFECSDGLVYNRKTLRENARDHELYFIYLISNYGRMFNYRSSRNCTILDGPKNLRKRYYE